MSQPLHSHPRSGEPFLLVDEFKDFRDKHNGELKNIVSTFRIDSHELQTNVQAVKTDIHTLKTDIHTLKTDIHTLKTNIQEVKTDMKQLRTELTLLILDSRRNTAVNRNKSLRHTSQRITPVPAFDYTTQTIIEPDPEKFPKTPSILFALKLPATDRQKDMLKYLIRFYDIPPPSSPEEVGDGIALLSALDSKVLAVDILAGILGLDHDMQTSSRSKFELRQRGPPAEGASKKRKLTWEDFLDDSDDEKSSPLSKETKLGYRNSPATSVESKMETVGSGTATNPNTPERQHRPQLGIR